jgi:hypothetical protein
MSVSVSGLVAAGATLIGCLLQQQDPIPPMVLPIQPCKKPRRRLGQRHRTKGKGTSDGAASGADGDSEVESDVARDKHPADDPRALAVLASREGSPIPCPNDCLSIGLRAPRKWLL